MAGYYAGVYDRPGLGDELGGVSVVAVNLFMLFAIGIIFSVLGVALIFFRKWFGFLPLILGMGAIYLVTWGPLKNQEEKLRAVLAINTGSIKEIKISPWYYDGSTRLSLLNQTIRLRDTIILRQLNSALRLGKIKSTPPNSIPKWACRIDIIQFNDKPISFGVRRHGSGVLEVASNGETGWVYGYIWADDFVNLIDSIVSAKKSK